MTSGNGRGKNKPDKYRKSNLQMGEAYKKADFLEFDSLVSHMDKKIEISRQDWKFMERQPYGDADFSEEHNRRVIAEVDEWNDAMDRKRSRDYKENVRERTDAVATYLRNISQGKGVHNIDEYFGRRYLAYLRGEEVVRQLKSNPALVEKLKNKMGERGKLQPL